MEFFPSCTTYIPPELFIAILRFAHGAHWSRGWFADLRRVCHLWNSPVEQELLSSVRILIDSNKEFCRLAKLLEKQEDKAELVREARLFQVGLLPVLCDSLLELAGHMNHLQALNVESEPRCSPDYRFPVFPHLRKLVVHTNLGRMPSINFSSLLQIQTLVDLSFRCAHFDEDWTQPGVFRLRRLALYSCTFHSNAFESMFLASNDTLETLCWDNTFCPDKLLLELWRPFAGTLKTIDARATSWPTEVPYSDSSFPSFSALMTVGIACGIDVFQTIPTCGVLTAVEHLKLEFINYEPGTLQEACERVPWTGLKSLEVTRFDMTADDLAFILGTSTRTLRKLTFNSVYVECDEEPINLAPSVSNITALEVLGWEQWGWGGDETPFGIIEHLSSLFPHLQALSISQNTWIDWESFRPSPSVTALRIFNQNTVVMSPEIFQKAILALDCFPNLQLCVVEPWHPAQPGSFGGRDPLKSRELETLRCICLQRGIEFTMDGEVYQVHERAFK